MNHWGGGGKGGFAQDDIKGKIYDRRLYGKMLSYLKPYLPMVFISFFVLMLITGAEVIIPLITRSAIDDHIVSDKTLVIFDDVSEAKSWAERYHAQKLKVNEREAKAYIVLSTKETNKINRSELKSFEDRMMLSPVNIYILSNSEKNRKLLGEYLPENMDTKIRPNHHRKVRGIVGCQ